MRHGPRNCTQLHLLMCYLYLGALQGGGCGEILQSRCACGASTLQPEWVREPDTSKKNLVN